MKKEVQIKSYKRRLKSGKVIVVKAHTAKRDVDESQKAGAGDEYVVTASGQKSSLDNIPYNVQTFSDEDFKEWYHFNDWDTLRSKWPKAVREVDDRLKTCMTKKNYDAFCAYVDSNWKARGYKVALTKWSGYAKEGSPAQEKSKIPRVSASSKKAHDMAIIKRDMFRTGANGSGVDNLSFGRILAYMKTYKTPKTAVTVGNKYYTVEPGNYGVTVRDSSGNKLLGTATWRKAITAAFDKLMEKE